MSKMEFAAGPPGVYLPEHLSPEQMQRGAQLAVDMLESVSPLSEYDPQDSRTAQSKDIYKAEYGALLEHLEQALSEFIPIDDADASAKLPRVGWLTSALEARAIQDTFRYYLAEHHGLAEQPDRIDSRSGNPEDLSAFGWMRIALHSSYKRAQQESRLAVLTRGDQAEIVRYAALDSLIPMVTSQGRFAFARNSEDRERSGFMSSVTSTLSLVKHIYTQLSDMATASGDPIERQPHTDNPDAPALVAMRQAVAAAIDDCSSSREKDIAVFRLAVAVAESSVTPYAHSMMDLKLDQFTELGRSNTEGLAGVANRTVAAAIGKAARLRFEHERAEPTDDNWLGSISYARAYPSQSVKYRCPGRRPAAETELPSAFLDLYGSDIHHRFVHSASDMSFYLLLTLAEQYITYLTEQDPSQSIADLLAKPMDRRDI